jgi:cell wall-associated NlpC family hydrolase
MKAIIKTLLISFIILASQNSYAFGEDSKEIKENFKSDDFTKKNKIVPVGQAKAGDIVFFQFDDDAQPDHVGIVTSNDGKGTLRTIEGNTSEGKGSQSNGDGVYAKKRAYSLVMGVARP